MIDIEHIHCPYCNEDEADEWAAENGFTAVKCKRCGFIYVSPRPVASFIKNAVDTGYHEELPDNKSAVARRVKSKIHQYRKLFKNMYADVWGAGKAISWLDVGAGYGEIVEAVAMLAPRGSKIQGIEPMQPKAIAAQALGLNIKQGYLSNLTSKYDFVSLVHVFSHIPDFRKFLEDIRAVLKDKGELFLETGNAADLRSRAEVPTELDLPDHLTFAGKKHIIGFLEQAGFEIVDVREVRRDGIVNFIKNVVKKLLGRNVHIRIPYTSGHRAVRIRAKLTRSN